MTQQQHSKPTYVSGVFSLILLILLDQITKYMAVGHLKGNPPFPVLPGVFELFYLENRGAAFGMLANRQWFFIFIALVMTAAAIYIYLFLPVQRHYRGMRICMVLIASGAVGNMIDRIVRRCVIDFLYVSLIDFPVFNLADCYVVIGAIALVLLVFTVHRNDSFSCLNPRKES